MTHVANASSPTGPVRKFINGDVIRCVRPIHKSQLNNLYVFDRYDKDSIPGHALALILLKGEAIRYFEHRFVLADESIVDKILAKYGA